MSVPKSPLENNEMRQVLQRYDIGQAHHLVYSYEELTRLGINAEFVFALLDVFEDDRSFSKDDFEKFSIDLILDYIRKTHQYYLQRKLMEIEQSIHLLMQNYPVAHPLLVILNDFFSDYKDHLTSHISVEESQLLPYIEHLARVEEGKASYQARPAYSLNTFLIHHHDTEKDLAEVREAILRYSPPLTSETPYRILLSQLQVFEKDLAVHALIEDEVLLPRAMNLERKWGA